MIIVLVSSRNCLHSKNKYSTIVKVSGQLYMNIRIYNHVLVSGQWSLNICSLTIPVRINHSIGSVKSKYTWIIHENKRPSIWIWLYRYVAMMWSIINQKDDQMNHLNIMVIYLRWFPWQNGSWAKLVGTTAILNNDHWVAGELVAAGGSGTILGCTFEESFWKVNWMT